MKKLNIIILVSIMALGNISVNAQNRYSGLSSLQYNRGESQILVKAYSDSLSMAKNKLDSVYKPKADSLYEQSVADGRFFKLFAPLTFYHSVADNNLLLWHKRSSQSITNQQIDDALFYIYMNRPSLVVNTENRLNKYGIVPEDLKRPVKHRVILKDKIAPVPAEPDVMPMDVIVYKPNFLTITGDYYLQFMQNYVTDNWYKGGESNYSMVGSVTMQANYNNKSGLKFDNKLELKLGLQSSRSDSLHKFKTTDDLIRYTGKLGLQASKSWYYTFQLLTYTQFCKGFKSNDDKVYSSFMAPFNLNLSLGMDYTVKTKDNKLTGNINLAPIAYNFRYVDYLSLATRYGLNEGSHTMNDYGSEFTFDLAWKLSDMIKWKTRLYGYTTYKRAELEWENTITFQFNQYISTNLFVYPRFDDGSAKDVQNGYWQLQEYASIGFAYSF